MQIQLTKTDCENIANKAKTEHTDLEIALAKKCLSLYEKLGEINNEKNTLFEAIYSASLKFDKATNGQLRNKRAKDFERQSEALVKRAEEMKIELEGLRNYG